jgi:hypothetical protein
MEGKMADAEGGRPDERTPDEWTADERRRIEELARERVATPELEQRTVAALRAGGLLAGNAYGSGLVPGSARPRGWRAVMLAMAASALFAAGAGAGYLAAMRTAAAREAAREAARPANEAGGTSAPALGARPETLAAQTPGGRHVTWY